MLVNQVYEFVNTAASEVLGDSVVLAEDLSNVVDVGTAILNASAYDNYVKSLVDHIGKVIFVDRVYKGSVPSLLMDGWEFGSVLEKISAELPEASENETWQLQDGQSYDTNIFYKPNVTAKFFNKRVTFEIDQSITRKQVMSAFSNAVQLNAFISMLYNAVEKAITIRMNALIHRTLNNMIAETLYSDYQGEAFNSKSGVKAVNLLYLYNETVETALTAEEAITNPDFIRFATFTINKYVARLGEMSTLFNVGGMDRFTPKDLLHVVFLNDFVSASTAFLQSDTFNRELVALPTAETVPYWQGSGTAYDFNSVSKIDVTTVDGHEVSTTGILGIMFDRDACGVSNLERITETNYVAKASFWNNYHKFEAGYFNDFNENFVVFFVA